MERTPTEAVVPGEGAHPEALRAPSLLASEVVTLRAAITRLTAENWELHCQVRETTARLEVARDAYETYRAALAAPRAPAK